MLTLEGWTHWKMGGAQIGRYSAPGLGVCVVVSVLPKGQRKEWSRSPGRWEPQGFCSLPASKAVRIHPHGATGRPSRSSEMAEGGLLSGYTDSAFEFCGWQMGRGWAAVHSKHLFGRWRKSIFDWPAWNGGGRAGYAVSLGWRKKLLKGRFTSTR